MERTVSENERRRRRRQPVDDRQEVALRPPLPLPLPRPPPMSAVPPMVRLRPPPARANEAKLAAIAVDLNIRLRSSDMPGPMQERAFRLARAVLDANVDKKHNPTRIAMSLKKEFDAVYGLAWHCIVGKSFGSFVTHSSGGFVYFSVDNKFSFLLFKTEVRPVVRKSPATLLLKQ